jgi:hypothetical protein
MLNAMASTDFLTALDQHSKWGLRWLDLKDSIFGKELLSLKKEEVRRVADEVSKRGLSVYCLSSGLFFGDIEEGPETFQQEHLGRITDLIRVATLLRPRYIRLLAARSSRRSEFSDSVSYINRCHPWLLPMYQEAIDRITDAGFMTTIENEVHGCLLSRPSEITDFFGSLERVGKVTFTWDVQNLWQMGTFPTLAIYEQLRPLIGYFHLKGGQTEEGKGNALVWASSLEDASWPVIAITGQVIADGVSPVICLNPSHGARKPEGDFRDVAQHDLAFLRRSFPEVES